jgi:hypothetical protein
MHHIDGDFAEKLEKYQTMVELRDRARAYGKAIHHIDGNPYNNDPANLRIVDIKKGS